MTGQRAGLPPHGIDAPHPLSRGDVRRFRDEGFVHLSSVFAPEDLRPYTAEVTAKVLELNTMRTPLEDRSTYDRAFLQVVNLWRHSEIVERFVRGRRLGRIAAGLLGVDGVRLYHDQALYKEPGGGHTPWHADQYYWPLASDACCTAWIPLQDTPRAMGPLAFAAGSHRFLRGRDLPIGDESERRLADLLREAELSEIDRDYALGDVSFHYGRTFHRAGSNTTEVPRRVMTIIYMDAAMRLAEPANDNQIADRDAFCPGCAVGDTIDTPMNPLIWAGD